MIDRVLEHIAARRAPMLDLLAELVLIGSFTGDREGGALVATALARELASIPGLTVRSIASDRYAPHLVASTTAAARSAEGAVALVGHLDTVFPPGTFEGFRLDGVLARGPGVLDMKGGLVVVLEALRALGAEGLLAGLPLRLVIVSDEEVGSPEGHDVLQRELAGAACALVFEAGRAGDVVITARKGTAGVTVTATGRAAHAGAAHADGKNAIWALARFIDRAQSMTDYDRGVTVNVGQVSGGHGKNTVPDHAEALLDFRFVTSEDGAATMAALARAGDEVAASVPGTTVTLSGRLARAPLERTAANVALYGEYAACARASGLGDGESPLLGGGSDASSTAAMGIPSIDGLGPRGAGFHTKDERIEVATLVPKAQALARFLLGRR